ncbi:unnamed protein product [Echinostoma caproni]|uniref:HMG box domain-containing protein n=1 Tax=Echinostoma caproni TaxID=27848 RepID=A0A183B3K8_9TREM|nr:unnamed protein product [Echinostoma caproni]
MALNLRDAVKGWNTLSEAERQVYSAKASDLKTEYEKQLHQWATEHHLRFTKNLTVLTQRFYERERKPPGRRESKDPNPSKTTTSTVRSKPHSSKSVSTSA